ncbi:PilZ domain-containing protein [Opitutaceae bacterium]|nr:PilZ domain-containing protein [Opitutaceae bacterium]MDB4473458.1 PilZ domain-containing protein [Opitutaceae bacterium]
MEFFKRILDFDEKTVARKEQRLSQRFNISPLAPLRGRLQISGLDYPVSLRDLSSNGAGVIIDSPVDVHEGMSCQITIIAESVNIPLNAKIARVASTESGTFAGLDLTANGYDERRCLVQVLEPISMGATLKQIDPQAVSQLESDLIAQRYYSSGSLTLTVWRRTSDDSIHGFELHMLDYYIRSTPEAPQIKIYIDENHAAATSEDFGSLTLRQNDEETRELRRLYNWITLRLSDQVPDDLNEFLQRYRTEFGSD